MINNETQDWYEESYQNTGFKAQRRYPNEELLRFFGGYFFNKTHRVDRKDIKVLEVGCGSCANIWAIAREGFDTYGLDLSNESLKLGQKMLKLWQVESKLKQGSFLELPYDEDTFDVVLDVFSMNCVTHKDFLIALDEVYKVLKPGGLFFSYTPGQNSDAFIDYQPAKKTDEYTLNGIYRSTSPFVGNHYPFHFWNKNDYEETLVSKGFIVNYLESIERSYYKGKDKFEHLIVYAQK